MDDKWIEPLFALQPPLRLRLASWRIGEERLPPYLWAGTEKNYR